MISPTGKGIRVDPEGSGEYGAKRGNRLHNGVDYICKKGQRIVAPFPLKILRIANPKVNSSLSGIEWQYGRSTGKIFYFKPFEDLIGFEVEEGQDIGVAQSVSEAYGLSNMIDHIHFRIDK